MAQILLKQRADRAQHESTCLVKEKEKDCFIVQMCLECTHRNHVQGFYMRTRRKKKKKKGSDSGLIFQ